ncbi:MAG: T9SS C-terminal target domain-containing protein [Saprospirales bacterium]|nr:MAG: T9SS C-terminal target domain-containing protein [Saprospirales bacterium]
MLNPTVKKTDSKDFLQHTYLKQLSGGFFLFFIFSLPFHVVSSQDVASFSKVERLNLDELILAGENEWFVYHIEVPDFEDPFISLTIKWAALSHSPAAVYLKKSTKEETFPIRIERDPHLGNDSTWLSKLLFFNPNQKNFDLYLPFSVGKLENISLHWFYPGNDSLTHSLERENLIDENSCACPEPVIAERSDWCPQNNCPSFVFSDNNDPTHLIVHHTAGTNQASNWSAVVRSIYNQHVNVNGWSDIGYHYLIDPHGMVYRGRTDEQIGAHFCSTNSSTLGVCVMGNFDLIEPTVPSLSVLLDLVAVKSCEKMIAPNEQSLHPPSGLLLNHISGHQDGCATACPGLFLYPLLPGLRELADQKLKWICMDDMPVPLWQTADVIDSKLELKWEYEMDAVLFDHFELQWKKESDSHFSPLEEVNSSVKELQIDQPAEGIIYLRIRAIQENIKSDWSSEIPVVISSIVGLNKRKSLPALFPNPVNAQLSIKLPEHHNAENINVKIFNVQGKMIKHLNWNHASDGYLYIKTSDLKEGIYFLEMNIFPDLRIPFLKVGT